MGILKARLPKIGTVMVNVRDEGGLGTGEGKVYFDIDGDGSNEVGQPPLGTENLFGNYPRITLESPSGDKEYFVYDVYDLVLTSANGAYHVDGGYTVDDYPYSINNSIDMSGTTLSSAELYQVTGSNPLTVESVDLIGNKNWTYTDSDNTYEFVRTDEFVVDANGNNDVFVTVGQLASTGAVINVTDGTQSWEYSSNLEIGASYATDNNVYILGVNPSSNTSEVEVISTSDGSLQQSSSVSNISDQLGIRGIAVSRDETRIVTAISSGAGGDIKLFDNSFNELNSWPNGFGPGTTGIDEGWCTAGNEDKELFAQRATSGDVGLQRIDGGSETIDWTNDLNGTFNSNQAKLRYLDEFNFFESDSSENPFGDCIVWNRADSGLTIVDRATGNTIANLSSSNNSLYTAAFGGKPSNI